MLQEKYLIPENEARDLVSFLEPMLAPDPSKRATAAQMLQNDWVRDVIVRGEEELAEREAELAQGTNPQITTAPLASPSAADALKPASASTTPEPPVPAASTSSASSSAAAANKKKAHKAAQPSSSSTGNNAVPPQVVSAKSQLSAPKTTTSSDVSAQSQPPPSHPISIAA